MVELARGAIVEVRHLGTRGHQRSTSSRHMCSVVCTQALKQHQIPERIAERKISNSPLKNNLPVLPSFTTVVAPGNTAPSPPTSSTTFVTSYSISLPSSSNPLTNLTLIPVVGGPTLPIGSFDAANNANIFGMHAA